jgi:hypothetical protein
VTDRWAEIWDRRSVDRAVAEREGELAALMAADGLDTGFGSVTPEAWRAFAQGFARVPLGLEAGDRLFEVGCGAGAFLLPLHEIGLRVGGIDRSAALIEAARRALPEGDFAVGDAESLAPEPAADAVVSCGVFLYFPGLDYADRVVRAMAAKARRAVAVLDVPDLARRDAALAERVAALGGEEAYRRRYEGLDHLYYDRGWLADRLRAAGLTGVETADQAIEGYANGAYRFNAWGFRR